MSPVRQAVRSMLLAILVTAVGVGALVGPRSGTALAATPIAPEAMAAFNAVKARTNDYAIFKLDAAGKLVVDRTAPHVDGFAYATFVQLLTANVKEPRFAVLNYRHAIEDENRTIERLIFISWAPDKAPVNLKMKYASAQEDVKKAFIGIAKNYQANDVADLDEANIIALVSK